MCFAEKDTPARRAKFRKTWNSKYKSIYWWRGVVILPVSAAQWLWTCTSTFMSQWCWPGREGSFYRRQLRGRRGREPSGQQLRVSLHLLSPPSLCRSSSPGAVSDWCVQHPKTFPGHSTTTLCLADTRDTFVQSKSLVVSYPLAAGDPQDRQGCAVQWTLLVAALRGHSFPPHSCAQVRLPPPPGRHWPVLQGCSLIIPWILTTCLLPQVHPPWMWCWDIWIELCSGCPGGAFLLQVPALVPSSPSYGRSLGCWACTALAGKAFWSPGVVFLLGSW